MLNAYFLQAGYGGFIGHITGAALIFLLCLYFLPTIIAMIRSKPNTGAILVLNLFLGWTFIGWIVALVWAVTANSQPQQVIIHNTVQPEKNSRTATTGFPETPVVQQHRENLVNSQTPSNPDKIIQLRQLKELLDDGTLTQEEFNQQKARILSFPG